MLLLKVLILSEIKTLPDSIFNTMLIFKNALVRVFIIWRYVCCIEISVNFYYELQKI